MWSDIAFRMRALFRRKRVESELDEELRAHFEKQVEKYIRAGDAPEEARRRARLDFGGLDQVKEECRDARGVSLLENLAQDTRFAARMLRKNPLFTAVAVVTLALGIGANTAIFSAVNTLLLEPLPVKDIDRIVFSVAMREGFDPYGSSLVEYQAFRDRGHSFTSIGLALQRSFNWLGRNEPEILQGAMVRADYLGTLGVSPVHGRDFSAEERRPGGPAVALIGYGLWRREFAGDPGAPGRTLNLDGRITTVVGVLPAGFDEPAGAQIWIPDQRNIEGMPLAERLGHDHDLVARLKPGVSREQADRELKAIAKELEREYPRERTGWSVQLIPLRQEALGDVTGRVEKALAALVAAVGFLLLICCANVASLLLAQGVGRERELALRRALGAGRLRVAGQLLTESTLLATLGGAAGVLLGYAAVPVLRALNPIETIAFVEPLTNMHIDGRVLGFAAGLTLLTAVLCGLMPAVKGAGSRDLAPVLKEGGQRGGVASGGRRWLAALVVTELAVAVPLLAGGGLLIRSFERLQNLELGFRPDHLLTMHLVLSPAKYREFRERVNFEKRLLEHVKSVPGVVSAGITTTLPLTAIGSTDAVFTVEGHPPKNPSDVPITAHRAVSPEYLQTLGVALTKGRLLDAHDNAEGQRVVVISEELARQGWPGEDPLGKRIRRVRPGQADLPWMTVAGVVKDVKEDRDNFRIARPVWYVPYEQTENAQPLDLVVKAEGDAASLAGSVREAVRAVDTGQPVSRVLTMNAHLAGVLMTERFSAVLMGALAGLGLALAMIGLYGVMSYSVSRQTTEMGLRAALGATQRDILGMVIGRALRLAGLGLSLGLAGALALTRFLSGALYRVNASDPLTFGAVAALLVLAAFAACYVPARRATRVDPIVALRHE